MIGNGRNEINVSSTYMTNVMVELLRDLYTAQE